MKVFLNDLFPFLSDTLPDSISIYLNRKCFYLLSYQLLSATEDWQSNPHNVINDLFGCGWINVMQPH